MKRNVKVLTIDVSKLDGRYAGVFLLTRGLSYVEKVLFEFLEEPIATHLLKVYERESAFHQVRVFMLGWNASSLVDARGLSPHLERPLLLFSRTPHRLAFHTVKFEGVHVAFENVSRRRVLSLLKVLSKDINLTAPLDYAELMLTALKELFAAVRRDAVLS